MSKRGRRRRRDRDDASDISSAPKLRSRLFDELTRPSAARSFLQDIEDRREFSPELFRPARTIFSRKAAQVVQHDPNVNLRKSEAVNPDYVSRLSDLRFSDPNRVAVCVRRHQRREVLHALKRVGRGSAVKKPRWSEFSEISCKHK